MWDLLEPVRYDSTTRHKPQTTFLGETFFLICKAPLLLSYSYYEKKTQALGSWIFWFISCLVLSCCCFFALLPCYELLALSNHIIISGLLLFWRSGGVRSLPYLLGTEVGGSSKVR